MGGDLDRLCVPRRQHDDDGVVNTLRILRLRAGTCLSRDNTCHLFTNMSNASNVAAQAFSVSYFAAWVRGCFNGSRQW